MDENNIFNESEGTEIKENIYKGKNKKAYNDSIDYQNDSFKDNQQPYREKLKISKKHIEIIG